MKRQISIAPILAGVIATGLLYCPVALSAQVLKGSAPAPLQQAGSQTQTQTAPNDPRRQGRQLTPQELLAAMHARTKRTGPKIHNPALSQDGMDLAVDAALKVQKQSVDIQKAQIMASGSGGGSKTSSAAQSTPAGTPGGTPGTPGKPNGGTGLTLAHSNNSPGTSLNPQGGTSGAPSAGLSARMARSTAITKAPAAVPPPPSSPPANPRALVSNMPTTVAHFDPSLACNNPNHDPQIISINGKYPTQAQFTNDPKFNLYTIQGCNFGDAQGQMHLFGGFTVGQVPMQIEYWSDTSIIANLAPGLTKELDQNDVKLVLVLANGHQTEFTHLKFYAARQKMLLASIPKGEYQPDPAYAADALLSTGSPDGNFTFGAARIFNGDTAPGTDKIVIDQLLPGFVISDVQLSVDEGGSQWAANFTGGTIQVNWSVVQDSNGWDSAYELNIWVSGPVGFTSPWKADNP